MKQGQHVIICGGGSGLGLGVAARLLQRGVTLSILDLRLSDSAESELSAAEANGGNWAFYKTDVTQAEAVRDAVNTAVKDSGKPELALNSAGVIANKSFAEMDEFTFRKIIDVNLHGSYNFAQAVVPHLEAGSRLALVASIAGLTSNYGYTAYGVSKFGVVGLATTLRYEYEPLGIHISCICPPEVKTPMVEFERTPGNANPISLALKDIAGSLEPDEACDAIVAGLDKGQWMIIPGFEGKATVFVARHFPNGFFWFMKRNIRKLMDKFGNPKFQSEISL